MIDNTIAWLLEGYESVFTDGNGEIKSARGKAHKYLRMNLDLTVKYVVKVTMFEYIEEVITLWDQACLNSDDGFKISRHRQRIVTPALDDLFKVDESSVKLGSGKAKSFHTVVAKALYVSKQARPDISQDNMFLTTRVREPDEDNWRKLRHLVVYFICRVLVSNHLYLALRLQVCCAGMWMHHLLFALICKVIWVGCEPWEQGVFWLHQPSTS